MRFQDKVVWITGASSGIGAALAVAFHRDGAAVALSARNAERLAGVRDDCRDGPGATVAVPLDVADPDALATAFERVTATLGRVDILVNNAGVAQRALAADTTMDTYRRLMEVNFFGAVGLTKLVLPAMRARGAGHIVAVTSVAGKYATPLRSGYNASKYAMHGFFDSLRAELAPDGIPVTLIVPGAVRTDISVNALTGDGAPYGRMNRIFANGMAPEACARRILDAVAARREEVMIADGEARRLVLLNRFLPRLAARMVRLGPRRSGHASTGGTPP